MEEMVKPKHTSLDDCVAENDFSRYGDEYKTKGMIKKYFQCQVCGRIIIEQYVYLKTVDEDDNEVVRCFK